MVGVVLLARFAPALGSPLTMTVDAFHEALRAVGTVRRMTGDHG
jgi:hypothetical protein